MSMAYQIANGGVALGSALFGPQNRSASKLYDSQQKPFEAAQQIQEAAIGTESQASNEQAQIASDEAGLEAAQTAFYGKKFRERQANQYSSSGVLLEGSPMRVLNETRDLVAQEVDAIARRGAAQSNLIRQRSVASSGRGRASLLGSASSFNYGRAQAFMSEAAQRNSGIQSALEGVGNLFQGNAPFRNPNPFVPKTPYTPPPWWTMGGNGYKPSVP